MLDLTPWLPMDGREFFGAGNGATLLGDVL
jgi:hypothetical protein